MQVEREVLVAFEEQLRPAPPSYAEVRKNVHFAQDIFAEFGNQTLRCGRSHHGSESLGRNPSPQW